jgi:predicted nucleotidyltransferase
VRFGLTDETRRQIAAIFAEFPQVDRAVIFGSRAKGCARPGSDVDLTLEGNGIDRSLLTKIECALDDSLIPYRFSLSARAMLRDPEFIAHIERVGVTFYERSLDVA